MATPINVKLEKRETRWIIYLLGIVADTDAPSSKRLAAITALQETLPDGHPLKNRTPIDLMEHVKSSTSTRWVYDRLKGDVERTVRRPPQDMSDLWD